MKTEIRKLPYVCERCIGFSIPENGEFYLLDWERIFKIKFEDKVSVEELKQESNSEKIINENESKFRIGNSWHPFLGLWGGKAILQKSGIGSLSLDQGNITIKFESNEEIAFQFENFSGDWEFASFDKIKPALIYGTPYDFDFRYVEFGI